jgi:hypothetical protein
MAQRIPIRIVYPVGNFTRSATLFGPIPSYIVLSMEHYGF